MQLTKPDYRTRTVFPLPDLDPAFSVEIRKLSDAETNRIYDAHKYIPNHPKQGLMGRFAKVIRDIVTASVVRVNHATDANGVALDPEADETKLLLLDTEVDEDGQRKTLWQIVGEAVEAEERKEAKNSQSA